MNWLSNSLINKLLAFVFATVLLMGGISLGSETQLSSAISEYDTLLIEQISQERQISAIVLLFKKQVQEWKNVLLRGSDPGQRDKYWGRFQDNQAEVQEQTSRLLREIPPGPVKAKISDFLKAHQDMASGYEKGFDAYVASGFDASVGDAAVSGIDRAPTKLLEDAAEQLAAMAARRGDEVSGHAATTVRTTFILNVCVIIAALSLAYFMLNRYLATPVRQIVEEAETYGSGDFSRPVRTPAVKDELHQVATGMNEVGNFIRELMARLQAMSDELRGSSNGLETASHEINKNTVANNDHVEGTAAAVTEMSTTAQEVAANAQQAAEAAGSADEAARCALEVMDATIASITNLADQVVSASNVIRKLEDDTNSVGTVLEVIRGIAEQTNLLALNAAIEAARAGDQGRGFAVVADEVRSLAQRTQESTTEIQQIIENVQTGATNAVSAMDTGRASTELCVTQAGDAGESLRQITDAVKTILEMNNQIAWAAREQNKASEDITNNIHQISSVSATTTELTQNLSHTSSELTETSRQLDSMIRRVKLS
jgi:methyl-accepting chemotaxis protein